MEVTCFSILYSKTLQGFTLPICYDWEPLYVYEYSKLEHCYEVFTLKRIVCLKILNDLFSNCLYIFLVLCQENTFH